MIRFEAHADVFPDTVVVMAGYQRVEMIATIQAKRIKDIRPAKLLVADACGQLAVVVMDDIVGSEQNIDYRAGGQLVAAAFEQSQPCPDAPVFHHAADDNATTDKVGDKTVGRLVIKLVRAVPLH